MTFAVPVVDIAPYVTDGTHRRPRPARQREMDAACRTVGFVQVVGHGVPAGITDGLAAAMDGLVRAAAGRQEAYRTPPEINRGYIPPKSESLSLSLGVEAATRMNDFFEAFNVGAAAVLFPGLDLPEPDYAENIWPDVPGVPGCGSGLLPRGRPRGPDADHGVRGRTRPARRLLRRLHRALDRRPADEQLRAPAGQIDLDGDLTGMGEHTDYGIVTVLWADQVRGAAGARRRPGLARRHAGRARCWSTSATSPPAGPTSGGCRRCTGSSRRWSTGGSSGAGRRRSSTTATSTRVIETMPDVPRAPARSRPTRRSRWAST